MSKVNLDGLAEVEITSSQQPDYDPMVVMRAIVACEKNIAAFEQEIDKQKERRKDFEDRIHQHEVWEAGGSQGPKPLYHHQSLVDGLAPIDQNIRTCREAVAQEKQKIKTLNEKLEAYQKFQAHVEKQK